LKAAVSRFESAPTLVLVGMMGAGKSTVGKRLAARLGRPFADTDRVLEERLGVSIPTIFELEGEAGFRDREAAVLADLLERKGAVLATGGGIVLREDNRRQLAERAWVIYLRASAEDLWVRTRRDTTRPLLRTADPRARIAELLAHRAPYYLEVANLVVETGRQPVERLIEHVMQRLAQDGMIDPAKALDEPSRAVPLADCR
jgi:shikimate kinase